MAVQALATGTTTTFAEAAECAAIERALSISASRAGRRWSRSSATAHLLPWLSRQRSGTALVPLGEATDAEAAALIEQAGAIAVITDRDLPLHAVHERTLGWGVRLLRLADRDDPPLYGWSVVLKLTA